MELFLKFGLLSTTELLLTLGLVHFVTSRKNFKKDLWLVIALALLVGYGYSFFIFIIEGEGYAVGTDTLQIGWTEIIIYALGSFFFTLPTIPAYVVIKSLLDKRE
ncbi:MAG: hypothetical protein AAB624_02085 [Patescibacteria group bacterium]